MRWASRIPKYIKSQQRFNPINTKYTIEIIRQIKIMSEDTLFTKIVNRQIPADILFQDERVTAFRDINPQAPCHILIVPNKPIPSVNQVRPEDEAVLGYLFIVARNLAVQQGISAAGYRLIINCGDNGGQEVYHLHMHLLGGKRIGRMVTGS